MLHVPNHVSVNMYGITFSSKICNCPSIFVLDAEYFFLTARILAQCPATTRQNGRNEVATVYQGNVRTLMWLFHNS